MIKVLFFLDSAKLDEIEYAITKWKIDGVTTNPRHLMNAGMKVEEFAQKIKGMIPSTDFTVSLEVNPHLKDPKDIVQEAIKLSNIGQNFVIKIPAIETGFQALAELKQKGIRVNMTLVFNLVQALQAARLGAFYISPFVGWKEERGDIDPDFISTIVRAIKNYHYESKILVAATRSVKHFVDAALCGADIITCAFDVYKKAFESPYTEMGLRIFSDSWDSIYR